MELKLSYLKNKLETLEKFLRKYLKLILSIPVNSPDPVVYILSWILPVEAQIPIKTDIYE